MRPPTLNIFPSQPMHAERPSSTSKTKHDRNKKELGSSSGQDQLKTPDRKSLRRLAQNREAARKCRLRKKAYVQQLELSSIKLNQLEQELQKAKAKGVYLGGVAGVLGADQSLPQETAAFDIEYVNWLEEHRQSLCRLQGAVEAHLSDNEIRICVENCIAHFDNLMRLKSMMVKFDVFHILSGMWKTPVERCFLWIGGFRPSELIKIIRAQIEPLTDHQIMGIFDLETSMLEAEEALSQALSQVHERLNQSLLEANLSENLKSPTNMSSYKGHVSGAMNKRSNLEDIVNQADKLRLKTIHRVHQLMTCRQAARSLLAISGYFDRLRTLSSMWATRDRHP